MPVQTAQQKLDSLAAAIAKGDLIDTNLNVVSKYGFTWQILRIVRCILRPIYALFGKDPYAHLRADKVGQAIHAFCTRHQADLSPALRAKAVAQIFIPLDGKTKGKYAQVKAAQNAVLEIGAAPMDPIRNRKAIVQAAVNRLSHQLHLRLAQDGEGSVCFSPVSIAAVLGLILKGMPDARGQQLIESLGMGAMPADIVHIALRELMDHLSQANGDICKFTTASALAAPERGVHAAYKRDITASYGAEIFPIGRGPAAAAQSVNDWVSGKTERLIQQLVTPADLAVEPPAQPFVLLNAVFFNGKWQKDFDEAVLRPFHLANGEVVQVKSMDLFKRLKGYQGDTFHMLEIPYRSPEGHELVHIVFLPNPGQALANLEERLTPEFVKECRREAHPERYEVQMPKADITLRVDTLLDTLQQMGIPIRGALPNLGEEAEVVKIIHQAKMKVDEKGTVAVAATAGIGLCMAAPPPMDEPRRFIVDRPFAYMIADGDQILFRGNIRTADALVQ